MLLVSAVAGPWLATLVSPDRNFSMVVAAVEVSIVIDAVCCAIPRYWSI